VKIVSVLTEGRGSSVFTKQVILTTGEHSLSSPHRNHREPSAQPYTVKFATLDPHSEIRSEHF
jgi:hypothetical protein